ncbi:MAG: colicin E5-related ribonuclease [Gemmatimonadaceae bacterium]
MLQTIHAMLIGDALGRIAGGVASARPTRSTRADFSIGQKVGKQMGSRGWSSASINETIANPHRAAAARDTRFLADGSRMDDAATAFINPDGSYVVRNNRTRDIVQISNRNDPNWKSPFEK